jgi:3-oxoacyl-[acyl-carrier-protein] synthase-3
VHTPEGTAPPPFAGYPARIAGTGVFTPHSVIDSVDLDRRHDRTPGTTLARSGVVSRRWAGPEETSSVMAAGALRAALAAADHAGPLDAVVVAGIAPEQPMPTTAVLVAGHLGLDHGTTEAFDVNASCLGFLTALEIAILGIAAGRWSAVGVAAAEVASKGLDHDDVESSALFGDGAGAAIVTRSNEGDGSCVLAARFATWPQGSHLCHIDAGGTRWNHATPSTDPRAHLFHMDGPGLLKLTARHLPRFLDKFLAEAGVSLDQIDVVVPHQASEVGLRFLKEKLGVPAEKVVDILADHGNQVSASVPTALHEAVDRGRIARGDTVLLLGTGAGLSAGALLVRF